MRLGIILSFEKNLNQLEAERLIEQFQKNIHIKYCLLNTSNSTILEKVFQDITSFCNNVTFLNIRKNSSRKTVLKAGSRMLQSNYNVDFVGFADCSVEHEPETDIDLLTNKYREIVAKRVEANLKKAENIKEISVINECT